MRERQAGKANRVGPEKPGTQGDKKHGRWWSSTSVGKVSSQQAGVRRGLAKVGWPNACCSQPMAASEAFVVVSVLGEHYLQLLELSN